MDRSSAIALISCDGKTEELVHLLRPHTEDLRWWTIIATQEAAVAAEWLRLPVSRLKPTSRGGLIQVASLVVEGSLSAVLCLQDPLVRSCSDPDAVVLLRMASLYEVPLATNLATARCLLETCLRPGAGPLSEFREALAAS